MGFAEFDDDIQFYLNAGVFFCSNAILCKEMPFAN